MGIYEFCLEHRGSVAADLLSSLSATSGTSGRLGTSIANMTEVKAVAALKGLFNVGMYVLAYVSNGHIFWNHWNSKNYLYHMRIAETTNIGDRGCGT